MDMNYEIKTVIFSVGIAHPLYNKPVKAKILSRTSGYNGRCIVGETVEPVHYPEDPEGILIYSRGKFVGYKTKPSHDDIWNGWVEKILD